MSGEAPNCSPGRDCNGGKRRFRAAARWLPDLLRDFDNHLSSDQAFADHVGRCMDVWSAALCFVLYTAIAIVIFVANRSLYGV